jgi:two-component system NtrC family response regulator
MTTKHEKTERPKVLVLDDNAQVRRSLEKELEFSQFRVTTAASVGEALHLIDTEPFEVLLCDLHTPGAGDSFTVVSRMRRTNPNAVTLLSTSFPALGEVIEILRSQVDEILVKPLAIAALPALIR